MPKVRVRDGTVTVHYPRTMFVWRGGRGRFVLNARIPWRIEVTGGANHVVGDLGRLRLAGFEMIGGASDVRLSLGPATGIVPIRVTGGMGKLQVRRPSGAAVTVRVSGGVGRVELDGQQAKAGGNVRIGTPGSESAADR